MKGALSIRHLAQRRLRRFERARPERVQLRQQKTRLLLAKSRPVVIQGHGTVGTASVGRYSSASLSRSMSA
jgi:hypothetical protein